MKFFPSIRLLAALLIGCWPAVAQLQPVIIGSSPNDGTGDPIRAAFEKLNANDSALWGQAFTTLPSLFSGKLDNTPTDRGDVTLSGGGATWTVDPGAITYGKIQNVTAGKLLGRSNSGNGVVEELTLGGGLSLSGTTLSAAGGGSGVGVIPVALVSDMRALSPDVLTNGAVFVQTAGRTVVGVGAALFRWDSSSTETANLGTVFTHNSVAGRFVYAGSGAPTADMFGAIPDIGGVDNGDDSAAIQNAFDTLPRGSILKLSRGTYRGVNLDNNRAISVIGDRASHPAYASFASGTNYMFAWGVGSEIEANGPGWIMKINGRPSGIINTAGDPNQEGQLQGPEIAYVSFFGRGRTVDAGGINAAYVDEMLIHHCGFYGLKKAAYWPRAGVRESEFSSNDGRYCGNADTTDLDCPDSVRGWAALMLMDAQVEGPSGGVGGISDHNNFNSYRFNQFSYSLGVACILDSSEVFEDGDDVVFDEQFEGNIWHGYLYDVPVAFYAEWFASANMRSSPLFISRATDRPRWIGDKFWFAGQGANHLLFEDNFRAPDFHGRPHGTHLGQVIGCTFYGNYNNETNNAFIRIKSGSRASVSDSVFIAAAGQTKVQDEGTPNDFYISSGRQNMSVLSVDGAATIGGSGAIAGGLTVGATGLGVGRTVANTPSAILQADSTSKGFLPPRVTTASAIAAPVEGLIAAETTAKRPIYYTGGGGWKFLAFQGDSGGGVSTNAGSVYSVSSTNALRSLPAATVTAYEHIFLSGYYSSGDGGGGWYWVDTADTTTPDDGGAVFVVDGIRLKAIMEPEPSIRRWGARSEDLAEPVAGTTAHIQKAINWAFSIGGTTLTVPSGGYWLEDTIHVKYRVSLRGPGVTFSDGSPNAINAAPGMPAVGVTAWRKAGTAQLILKSGVNKHMLDWDTTGAYVRVPATGGIPDKHQMQSTIEGIVFHGNWDNQTRFDCHGIKALYHWGIVVRNCGFFRIKGYNAFVLDCNTVNFFNCISCGQPTTGKSFFFYSCADTRVFDNEFGLGTGPVVWITGGGGSWVSHYHENLLYNGQRARYAGSSIAGNTITLASNHTYETGMPVEVLAGPGGSIPTGTIESRCYFAIKVSASQIKLATGYQEALAGTALTISGGSGTWYVFHGYASGIYMSHDARALTVIGNRTEQHFDSGITLANVDHNVIANNETGENSHNNDLAEGPVGPTGENQAGIYVRNGAAGNVITGNAIFAELVTFPQNYGIWIDSDAGVGNMIGQNSFMNIGVSNIVSSASVSTMQVVEKDIEDDDKVTLGWLGAAGPQLELLGGAGGVSMMTLERSGYNKFGLRMLGETTGAFGIGDVTDDKFLWQLVRPTTDTLKMRVGGSGPFQFESRATTIQADEPGGTNIAAAALEFRPPWGSGSGSAAGGVFNFKNPVATSSGTNAHTSLTTVTIRAPLASRETSLQLLDNDTGTKRTVLATNVTVDGVLRTILILQ